MERVPDNWQKLHIQKGKEKRVAFVFSCPGRHEELAGYPAAKGTGRNLEILLSLLSQAMNRNDLTRENITITNAWPCVEYKAKTGRTEATIKEILSLDNVARLQEELQEVTDFIVFCGGKAKEVSKLLKLTKEPKLVYIEHLGLRGLSLIRCDVDGQPIVAANQHVLGGKGAATIRSPVEAKRQIQCENNRKRLEVLAHRIVSQLSPRPPGEG